MGWNSVSWESNFSSPIMKGIENGDQFYFVHSFHVVVQDPVIKLFANHLWIRVCQWCYSPKLCSYSIPSRKKSGKRFANLPKFH